MAATSLGSIGQSKMSFRERTAKLPPNPNMQFVLPNWHWRNYYCIEYDCDMRTPH